MKETITWGFLIPTGKGLEFPLPKFSLDFNRNERLLAGKMQCKDINEIPILQFLSESKKSASSYLEESDSIKKGFPMKSSRKLILAKIRKLISQGLVDGCACGCRGNFTITKAGRNYLSNAAKTETPKTRRERGLCDNFYKIISEPPYYCNAKIGDVLLYKGYAHSFPVKIGWRSKTDYSVINYDNVPKTGLYGGRNYKELEDCMRPLTKRELERLMPHLTKRIRDIEGDSQLAGFLPEKVCQFCIDKFGFKIKEGWVSHSKLGLCNSCGKREAITWWRSALKPKKY